MSPRDPIRDHARAIADGELRRCRSWLHELPNEQAATVADLVHTVALSAADALVEVARDEPAPR